MAKRNQRVERPARATDHYALVKGWADLNMDRIVPSEDGKSVASTPMAWVERVNSLLLPAIGRNTVLHIIVGKGEDDVDLVIQVARPVLQWESGYGDWHVTVGFGNERQEVVIADDSRFSFAGGEFRFGMYALPWPREARVETLTWHKEKPYLRVKVEGRPIVLPAGVLSHYTMVFRDNTPGLVKLRLHRDVPPWEEPNRAVEQVEYPVDDGAAVGRR